MNKKLFGDRYGAQVVFGVGVVGLIIIVVVALIIASLISLTIGFLGFVGLMFLVASAYLLFKKKGQVKISLKSPFAICVLIGLVLIGLSSIGLEVYYLDLSVVPGLSQLRALL